MSVQFVQNVTFASMLGMCSLDKYGHFIKSSGVTMSGGVTGTPLLISSCIGSSEHNLPELS